MRSLMAIMTLDLAVPDHATLARRRRTVDVQYHRVPRKRARSTSSSKALGSSSLGPANGQGQNTVRPEDPGASCISRSIRPATRSWPMSSRTTTRLMPQWWAIWSRTPAATSVRSSLTELMMAPPSIRRSARRDPVDPHRGSLSRPASLRSRRKANLMAEPSASVMPRRSRFGDAWPGRDGTAMANARWSKRPSPASTGSTAECSRRELWCTTEPSRHSHRDRQPQHDARQAHPRAYPLNCTSKTGFSRTLSVHQSRVLARLCPPHLFLQENVQTIRLDVAFLLHVAVGHHRPSAARYTASLSRLPTAITITRISVSRTS